MKKKPASLELALQGEIGPEEDIGTAPSPARGPAPDVEKLTVYVPRSAARRIKQMALDHDKRVNDFLQEGVDMMLKKYGQPPLAEFKAR